MAAPRTSSLVVCSLVSGGSAARADAPQVRTVGCIGLTVSDGDGASPAVAVGDQEIGFSRALLAHDPDGHVLEPTTPAISEARRTA
ncbi:MAG TPA: hypothetical protein VFG53_04630 [Anaeromyxobacter sp.]|nr:hypothetical protein [Anaeromyxobacter sp.]